jgi:hypothetical protein
MKLIARSIVGLWFLFCGAALAQTALFSHANSLSLGTSLVVETKPQHVLAYFNCTGVVGGAAGWCIAYNGVAAPNTGSLTGALVLDACYFDTSGAGCLINYSPGGIEFSLGITILVTSASSPFTYTTGTDTAFISANYN